jgi:UDP-N-acetylglucosamine diphosphorylase / glucose-1-phosphate thymidylyltransferase / UDP-N-acetylgalactosamine diphosphorylase / glucosamine-1-phosphate N-acetyltransferase / galactosamine-1-phosphate N-acetyltransferase
MKPLRTAIILAAGQGKRLQPLSLTRSKAMMPIAGQPIVARVMHTLAAHGVEDFILVGHPADAALADYFEHHFGGQVRFAWQTERRGMAHALACAAPLIEDDFILSACDNLVDAAQIGRLQALWNQNPRPNGVLTLLRVPPEKLSHSGVVALDGDWVTRIVEKPTLAEAPSDIISLPLYAFSQRLLDFLPEVPASPRGEYELQDAIQMLIERAGQVRGLLLPNRLTLTDAADLLAINLHYLVQEAPAELDPSVILSVNTRLFPPYRIEAGVTLGAGCTLGPGVYLESGCTLGAGATLQEAVVLRGGRVAAGEQIRNKIIG